VLFRSSIGPSTFDLYVQPANNANIGVIEESINFILHSVISGGMSEEKLTHAKQAMTAWRIYRQEGLSGMAFTLGMMKAVGLPVSHYQNYATRIQAVTMEDLQQAARDTLRPDQSVTAMVQPAEEES